jgi:hypothetical protein
MPPACMLQQLQLLLQSQYLVCDWVVPVNIQNGH